MAKKKKKQPDNRVKFIDEQKNKRIYEHLTIREDIISEEDIRNVRTDITEVTFQVISAEKKENSKSGMKKNKRA